MSKAGKQGDRKLFESMCDPSKCDLAVRWNESCRCTQNGGLTLQLRISKMHLQATKAFRDGLNDFDEVRAGTDPTHPGTDRDGWLDGAEKAAGSDPLSQISTPINP